MQFPKGGQTGPPYFFAFGWNSMNKPLLCANTFSPASAITASVQCFRPSLCVTRPSSRRGTPLGTGRRYSTSIFAVTDVRPRARTRFAHRLIQKRGDHSAVQVARMACKGLPAQPAGSPRSRPLPAGTPNAIRLHWLGRNQSSYLWVECANGVSGSVRMKLHEFSILVSRRKHGHGVTRVPLAILCSLDLYARVRSD